MKRIYVVGTADTKGEELAFLADAVAAAGLLSLASMSARATPTVAGRHRGRRGRRRTIPTAQRRAGQRRPRRGGRGHGRGLRRASSQSRDDIAGIIGIGGGGGTSIITAGMRAAAARPAEDHGLDARVRRCRALCRCFRHRHDAVGDRHGRPNRLSRASSCTMPPRRSPPWRTPAPPPDGKPALGLTMFGVTTPCVTAIADAAARRATTAWSSTPPAPAGAPWRSWPTAGCWPASSTSPRPKSATSCSAACSPATEDRFGAIARTKLPYVGSVGALDMVNFWAPETVPERYRGRLFYEHNPNVTLMRTTADECREIGAWIGDKLNACDGRCAS